MNQKRLKLFNWLRKDSINEKVYITSELVDNEDITTGEITEGAWKKEPSTKSRESLSITKANNPTQEAKAIRKEFNEYIFNEESVAWQWRCTRIDV